MVDGQVVLLGGAIVDGWVVLLGGAIVDGWVALLGFWILHLLVCDSFRCDSWASASMLPVCETSFQKT